MKVAILGASTKPDRYAHRAQKLLQELGHVVAPVNPRGDDILGVLGTTEIPAGIDTVTIYIRAERLFPILDQVIAASPRRVIFNPGTESPEAVEEFTQAGIETENACTLVLLNTGSF